MISTLIKPCTFTEWLPGDKGCICALLDQRFANWEQIRQRMDEEKDECYRCYFNETPANEVGFHEAMNDYYKYSIDEIMDMLDWHHSAEIQEKGVKLGSKIRCLKAFMQPMGKMYGKIVHVL